LGASEDVLNFLEAVGGEISDHLGRVTPIIAQAMPYRGSQASLSSLLHSLEKRGLIVRDIRHRRSYKVKLAPLAPAVPSDILQSGVQSSDGLAPSGPPKVPVAAHTPTDAWAAERAIYSAAIKRARERIDEFEDQLAHAVAETNEAIRRADDLQEQMAMAERTIGSMRTQLLDARKQVDLLRRKGAGRPFTPAVRGVSHGAGGAERDRLMRERPDR
jgi:hypothetical protein